MVLKRLGQEFREASQTADPTIEWSSATVTLEAVVTREVDGRVRFWVIEAGGGGGHQRTVTVAVNLNPYQGGSLAAGA